MHPLLIHVRSVARQARRMLIGQALARWMWVVVTAAFAAGFVDFLFRLREAPLRWLSFAAVCGVALWSLQRWIWPALAGYVSDVQVARQIERRFPDLHEQLSNAVAFLSQPRNDPRFGSGELRDAVVGHATAAIAQRDLRQVVDWSELKRAAFVLGATVAVLGLFSASDVRATRTALARLAMPWREIEWPRRHDLKFVQSPRRLAVGQDFHVTVIDRRGRLPPEVKLLLHFDGDDEREIREQLMTFAGGKMTHRLAGVTRSFRYRAVGGDDQEMPWTELTVTAPPRITRSQVTIRPPAYTRLPIEISERRVRAWEQSTIQFQLQFDRPLASANLLFRPRDGIPMPPFVALLAADGRSGTLGNSRPWTLTESGEYCWELTDRDGLKVLTAEHSEVEIQRDARPTIALESPAADAEFTIHAVVPLVALVTDDLAVQSVEWRRGGRGAEIDEHDAGASPSFRDRIEWDLSELPSLPSGAKLSVEVEATDFKLQSSERATATLTIISDEEFQSRIDERRARLLRLLHNALQTQRIARQQTNALAAPGADTSPVPATIAAQRPGLEAAQRRVAELVVDDDGATQLTVRLLEDLAVNRFESPQLTTHLAVLRDELTRIGTELLPPIPQALASGAWSAAMRGQDVVIAALEALVDRHGQWDQYNHLADEARQLLNDQARLADEARSLPSAGRDLAQLSADERMSLERVTQRSTELAQQVDRLHERLEELRRQLAVENPAGAKMLAEAMAALEQAGVSEPLRAAARNVIENRLGAADREFARAQAGLENLVAALEQRSRAEEAARIEQLAAKAVAAFLVRQQVLLEATAKSSDSARVTELARDQGALTEDVKQLAQKVEAPSLLSAALQLVAQPMQVAAARLQQALHDEPTLAAQQLACDRLRQLHDALRQRSGVGTQGESRPPVPEGAPEQSKPPAPSLADLKLIRLIQTEINRRTAELDAKRNGGELSEEDQRELDEVHAAQRTLVEKLERTEKVTWEGAELFQTIFVQAGQATPVRPADPLNDLLPHSNQPAPAGEDVGQTASPVALLRDQMRHIEARLRNRDTTTSTQKLQSQLVEDLSRLIDDLEQQDQSQSPQPSRTQPMPNPNEHSRAQSGKQAGNGSGGTSTDPAAISNWARGVWGELPERVQRQMQSLNDEQFLPEYADLIRGYYQRLSERGAKPK